MIEKQIFAFLFIRKNILTEEGSEKYLQAQ
jgi:hypothetical protein